MTFKTIDEWRTHIGKNTETLKKQVDACKFTSSYYELVALAFLPALPKAKSDLNTLIKTIQSLRYGEPLAERLKAIYAGGNYDLLINDLVEKHLARNKLDNDELEGVDWLLISLDVLNSLAKQDKSHAIVKKLLTELHDPVRTTSSVRVQAQMISAGQNVIFAGQDVNVVTQNYTGNKAALRSYLGGIRATWNQVELGSIVPGHNRQVTGLVRLHQLYTPVDVWNEKLDDKDPKSAKRVEQIAELRFRAIEADMSDLRRPVLEAIAIEPLIVITGGAGTGKSALCRYIAVALAYACDPGAEKQDKVDGLSLLGSSWIHGALLPVYINLRNFAADKETFNLEPKTGAADILMAYLRKTRGTFANELEKYLTNTDVTTFGALLILDGLDEVSQDSDRIRLQRIIENWADRFSKCRIIVTSRTYAYRDESKWRLSSKFASAELSPYTWSQMRQYINNWYAQAAIQRPASFGGRDTALARTTSLATDLMNTIQEKQPLWALARQPLMLVLLTLIHEDNKRLPVIRAELYSRTVELLDRWNIPAPEDMLAKKLATLNLDRMRAALKLVAFDLQKQQVHYRKDPGSIQRKDLLDRLMEQQKLGQGLGASIEDVLEYLNTRNGILVSDKHNVYRFPHLSIQEYLAACALIELYDECVMPEEAVLPSPDGWSFPANLAALLKTNPYRWRNVAFFAGSIIATGAIQDMRWSLIEALLPEELTTPVAEEDLHGIYVAGEIWHESFLKARNRLQKLTQMHLTRCLQAIRFDDRLDAPERATTSLILARLEAME